MNRRAWLLFATMCAVWGVPYLLLRVAVRHLSPPVVVFGRTAIAAAVLLPLAAAKGALRPALARWRPVLAFAAIEMAGPWILLTHAETRLPSGLTGLLIAGVPLIGSLTAFALGDRRALHATRLLGIAIGLGGVALLVGKDLRVDGAIPWINVVEVAVVCIGYATAPFIAARRLSDVPTLGVVAVSLTAVALVYLPFTLAHWPERDVPARVWAAIATLALVCTALAFMTFFALIAAVGPDRATFITYVNPAVALVLGAVFLDEKITQFTLVGFVLVIAGCAAATRPPRRSHPVAAVDVDALTGDAASRR